MLDDFLPGLSDKPGGTHYVRVIMVMGRLRGIDPHP